VSDLLNIKKLLVALIKGQDDFIQQRAADDPLQESTRQWCDGRRSAWVGMLEYVNREIDNEWTDYGTKEYNPDE
jgi:hypothetical protein